MIRYSPLLREGNEAIVINQYIVFPYLLDIPSHRGVFQLWPPSPPYRIRAMILPSKTRGRGEDRVAGGAKARSHQAATARTFAVAVVAVAAVVVIP